MLLLWVLIVVWLGLSLWLSIYTSDPKWGPADIATNAITSLVEVTIVLVTLGWIIQYIYDSFWK